MPNAGVIGLAVLASLYVAFAPLRRAFIALVLVVLMVPDTLVIPNGLTAYLSFHRVVILAFTIGMFARQCRGSIRQDAFTPRKTHLVFLAFLAVALVNGVGLTGPSIPTTESMLSWAQLADQFVFFTAVLAAIRAIGDDWWVAKVIAGALATSCAIAVGEHFIGQSYAGWFLRSQRGLAATINVRELALRGGQLRVRAGAQFALAFAWVSAILFPMLLIVVSRARRRVLLALVLPAGVLAAIFWSFTRSALAGAGAGVLLLWLFTRLDRRIGVLFALGGIAVALALATTPTLTQPYQGAKAQSSIDARFERLPVIFEAVAEHPYRGLGLGGLRSLGFPATDNSYLRFYGDLGIVGLVSFLILIVVVLLETSASLRGPPSLGRLAGAAAFTGIVIGVLGANASSNFNIPGSAFPIWTLVALALAIGERRTGLVPALPKPSLPRALVPALAIVAGLVISATGPTSTSSLYQFQTLSAAFETKVTRKPGYIGQLYIATGCTIASGIEDAVPGFQVRCRKDLIGPGIGQIQLRAPDRKRLGTGERQVLASLHSDLPVFWWQHLGKVEQGTATIARTAPVWLGIVGGAWFLLAGPFRRRRPAGPRQGRLRLLAVAG